jgi:hypothetical protein
MILRQFAWSDGRKKNIERCSKRVSELEDLLRAAFRTLNAQKWPVSKTSVSTNKTKV